MLTLDALKAYGADTQAGLTRCLNDEAFYLGLVEMLLNDERFDSLFMAVRAMNVRQALHEAYALSQTANSLALNPLANQIEMMILCQQIRGDSEVLDKQLRIIEAGLEQLRQIDMT